MKNDDFLKNVGAQMRAARLANGLTLKQVGEKVGFGKQYISGIERGVQTVSFAQLQKIADAMGYEVTIEFRLAWKFGPRGGTDPGKGKG